MGQNIAYTLRVIWACMKKDIKSALTERTFTIIGILVPLNVLILLSLFVIGGGIAPTAVVMNDTGPYAQLFYRAMSEAHSFRLQQTDQQDANTLLHAGRIVAIVTVPAEFDQRMQDNEPVQIDVQVNNLNAFHNFTLNTYGLSTNILILCLYALVTITLAALVLRRSTVAH